MHAAVFRQDNKIDHEVHEERNLYHGVFVLFVSFVVKLIFGCSQSKRCSL